MLGVSQSLRKPAGGPALALCLCLAAWLAWAAPAAAAASPQPITLVIGVGRDLYDGPDSSTYVHGSLNAWESLTYLDQNLRAQPWLAESWQSRDGGRTWIFHLRQGVRFHNGAPFTSREAAANLLRLAGRAKYDPTGIYRNVIAMEPRGQHELVFRLAKPSPAFPNLLAYFSSPMIHPSCFDEEGRIRELIATGPFRVKKIQRGDRIELEAFAGHWAGKPAYDRVVFRFVPDAQTRLMALLAGEVDAVADVGAILPEQAAELAQAPQVALLRQEVATTHYLVFNCGKPPFSERQARLWLASILDRAQVAAALAHGAGVVARDPYSPLARDWAFGLLNPPPGEKPDPPARELIVLLHGGTTQRWPYLEIAQVLQQKLAAEGFRAGIEIKEPGAYYESMQKGEFDLALQPNTLMTGDPDFFYSYYLHSQGPRSFGCGGPALDRLIEEARFEMDLKRRQALYRELAETFNRELPLLPLYHDISLYAHRQSVLDFQMDQNFRPSLAKARPRGRP